MRLISKRKLDDFRAEIQRRDQEILAMSAKMKTLEEQHQDYQRHIAVLKESLCAKEEHYNMMQADVEELRNRLDEKNRAIEKKTQQANQATAEKNRLNTELNEIRDHMDIKDRKINVLQRKLELLEANKKLQSAGNQRGGLPPGAEQEMNNLRRQLDEARRQMDQQKSQFEEYRKQVDNRARQLDERDKSLANIDQQLKKRKEQLDQLESQLRKGPQPSQGGVDHAELEKLVNDLAQAQENAKRSQEEMDRLLKLVQMSQEEQNAKEKQIHDLQTALKNAQAKIKQQQQQQAQADDEEPCEIDGGKPTLETVELLRELSFKESRIADLESDVVELEQALTERGSMAELEELVDVVKMKNDRIEELEEALRESVRITADRENLLQEEQMNRKHIMEKVGKLEQRLLSLQNAHALRCSICRPLVTRFKKMEKRLVHVLSERRKQLQDLARMKREALEAAISEKDAHLGLLELSGIRTARQAEEYEQLRSDRKRLMERLKEENERSIELIHEFSEDFDFLTPPIVDFDDEGEDNDERDHSNSTDASRSSENSTSDDGEGL